MIAITLEDPLALQHSLHYLMSYICIGHQIKKPLEHIVAALKNSFSHHSCGRLTATDAKDYTDLTR